MEAEDSVVVSLCHRQFRAVLFECDYRARAECDAAVRHWCALGPAAAEQGQEDDNTEAQRTRR